MALHEHKMTRLHVGPPKRYYCETPGCDYEMSLEQARVMMRDAPGLVTSTVAALNGEQMVTPTQVPVVVTNPAPTKCPKCGWSLKAEAPDVAKPQVQSEVKVEQKGTQDVRRTGSGFQEPKARVG